MSATTEPDPPTPDDVPEGVDPETGEILETGPVMRPFADFLREQGKGELHEELTEKLHELVGGVTDTGKPGTLTMQLKVAPMKGNPEVLTVTDVVVVKVPRNERRPSIFYADDDGNLTKTDPNQPQLAGLKIAGGGTKETKK